jgi:hypothetical protein
MISLCQTLERLEYLDPETWADLGDVDAAHVEAMVRAAVDVRGWFCDVVASQPLSLYWIARVWMGYPTPDWIVVKTGMTKGEALAEAYAEALDLDLRHDGAHPDQQFRPVPADEILASGALRKTRRKHV